MAEQPLRLRVVLDLVDKALAPLKRIGDGSNQTARAVKSAQDQLKAMGETQKAIGDWRQARSGLQDLQAQLGAARDKARAMALSYAQSGPPTQAMQAAMAQARAEARQAGAAFDQQQQHLQRLRDRLSAAGISTRNLSEHERQLRADIARQSDAIQKRDSHLQRSEALKAARQSNLDTRKNAREAMGNGVTQALNLAQPVKMAMALESSIADVGRAMNLAGDSNGLARMGLSAIDLSKRLPVAATDIAKLMAVGAESGMGIDELVGAGGNPAFAEQAVKMGRAFGMSGEASAKAMAQVKTALSLSLPEVATLTDKINLLGGAAGANEQQILGIVSRMGPLGALAGSASGEIAALGATLAGAGVQQDAAAGGIRHLMQTLTAGTNATQGQRNALQALGLDAAAVAQGMQADANGTMAGVFERLGQLDKGQQAAALKNLFGADSAQAITPLLGQLDKLRANLGQVGDASRYAGSVDAEYAASADNTADKLQLARNQVTAAGLALGTVMLPAVKDLLTTVTPWLGQISVLIQTYPGLAKALYLGVAALVALRTAAAATTFVFSYLRGAMLAAQGVLMTVRAGWMLYTGAMAAGTGISRAAMAISKGLTAAQWLFNAAMAANPLALFIIAIVALVAAGVMLYRNWDQIVAGGKALWNDLAAFLQGLWNGIASRALALWNSLSGWMSSLWSAMVAGAQALVSDLLALFSGLWSGLAGAVAAAGQWLGSALSALWTGLRDMATAAWQGLVSGVADLLGAGVLGWIQTLLNARPLEALWEMLVNALASLGSALPQQFADLGSFLVDGLINGILGKLGQLRDTVLGAADSAASWFREKLGLGASVAIQAGQSGARAATLAVAGAAMVPAGAQAGLDPAGLPGPSAALAPLRAPAAPAPGGGGAAAGNTTYQVTIQAPPGLDERALARLVAQELERLEQRTSFQRRSSLQDLN